jgi:hypothetical protein
LYDPAIPSEESKYYKGSLENGPDTTSTLTWTIGISGPSSARKRTASLLLALIFSSFDPLGKLRLIIYNDNFLPRRGQYPIVSYRSTPTNLNFLRQTMLPNATLKARGGPEPLYQVAEKDGSYVVKGPDMDLWDAVDMDAMYQAMQDVVGTGGEGKRVRVWKEVENLDATAGVKDIVQRFKPEVEQWLDGKRNNIRGWKIPRLLFVAGSPSHNNWALEKRVNQGFGCIPTESAFWLMEGVLFLLPPTPSVGIEMARLLIV